METAHLLIGIKVVSWLIGFIIFYLFTPMKKAERKQQFQEVTSQLVNFILFLWLGKILLNFSSFVKSPLAILAYPSNAQSFYFATFLTFVIIAYKHIKKQIDVSGLLEAFMTIFVVASFAYEFFQLVVNHNTYGIYQFVLAAILILFYLGIQTFVKPKQIGAVMGIAWSIGALGLYTIQPLFIIFGYTLAPWFLIVLLTGSSVYLMNTK